MNIFTYIHKGTWVTVIALSFVILPNILPAISSGDTVSLFAEAFTTGSGGDGCCGGSSGSGNNWGGGNNDNDHNPTTIYVDRTPLPTCSLSANPSSITTSGSATLSWTSSNATSASLNQGIGSVSVNSSRTVSPNTTTTYTLTVTNSKGSATCATTVTISQVDTKPTCDISVNDSSIAYGDNVVVSWSSSRATSMYISGIGTVAENTSGSRTISNLTYDRTFTCTARDDDGDEDTDSVTVTVDDNDNNTKPTCDVRVSDSSVDEGDDVTLYWESDDATSMYISGIGYVDANESGSKRFYDLSDDRTFTCTAKDDDGDKDTDSVTVHVSNTSSNTRPTCDIRISDTSIDRGESVTLYWESDDATSMYISNVGYVDENESDSKRIYNITSDTTFTCTARDDDGNKDTDSVTVRVSGTTAHNLPTCDLRASNTNVVYGGNTTLTWDTNDGDYATLTGVGAVALDGSQGFYSLRTSQTYTLSVTNDAGTRTCNATVYVAPHVYTPTPTYTAPTYTPPVVTYTAPQHQVALSHVPYTGAEDYVYPGFLFALVLTAVYALYNRRALVGIA